MNTRILSRMSISLGLLVSLNACSDATQFSEKTLAAGALDSRQPGTPDVENPGTETPSEEGMPTPDDMLNEDDPTGIKPGSEGDDPNAPGSMDPGVGTGSGGSGSGAGGSGSGGTGGAGNGNGSGGDVFTACSNDPDRAIVAQLYHLPVNTQKLPDFSSMNSLGDVCVSQLNIADRAFTQGFPGVSDIFEWFALDMRFKLTISKAGTYQFYLNSDDGSILSVDNSVVIDNDGQHAVTEKTGSVYLGVGVHDVRVRYFQGPRERIALELFWKVPGTNQKVIVPKTALSRP